MSKQQMIQGYQSNIDEVMNVGLEFGLVGD